ncbi:hypothetical protein E3N88_39186 [Mikania micrantha]|uniref:Uncharacterized protein n=1 Tax=Mikania micrantha TaxID=192012 RepID=A0A5N6LW30_9ASTR|nr:hypothetical protein E3N88_39186 [Mikania micrantha]
MFVSVASGPWDALFGGGNLPAFVVGAMAATISGILAFVMLPSPPPDVVLAKQQEGKRFSAAGSLRRSGEPTVGGGRRGSRK